MQLFDIRRKSIPEKPHFAWIHFENKINSSHKTSETASTSSNLRCNLGQIACLLEYLEVSAAPVYEAVFLLYRGE